MQEIDSCEVPIELINQPVPDVAHVAISPEGEFVDKDFELRIAISRFNFTHDWWKTNSYYTVPDFVPQLKQRVLDFVLPMFQPALDNLAEDESEIEEGTVSVHGIDLTGYYWTSSNEFYYSLELTKARVSRRIKNDIVELFPSG